MLRQRRNLVLAVALVAGSTSGCRGRSAKAVAVIPESTAHVYWVSVEAGARAAAAEYGLELVWNGPPTESDIARQIQILDSMVARRVDGIAIAACERKALVDPVERAVAAGISVTVFDSGVDSTRHMSFIATDNVEAGRIRFVGFDWSEAMLEDPRTGVLDAIVVQDPFRMGFEAVKSPAEKIEGLEPPKRLDLPARLARAADLELPEVKALLAPDPRKRRHP